MTMTEQEKIISQFCIAAQEYCNDLREEYDIGAYDSYFMDSIENCIEKIHRMVNPDFDKICEQVEAFEGEEREDDE